MHGRWMPPHVGHSNKQGIHGHFVSVALIFHHHYSTCTHAVHPPCRRYLGNTSRDPPTLLCSFDFSFSPTLRSLVSSLYSSPAVSSLDDRFGLPCYVNLTALCLLDLSLQSSTDQSSTHSPIRSTYLYSTATESCATHSASRMPQVTPL